MAEVSTIGLDIAKAVFHAHGADARGQMVFSRRLTRAKLLELSDTAQGARYVDASSASRSGDYAHVDTELRMNPVISRREQFNCVRCLMLVDSYMVLDMHQPRLERSVRAWEPVDRLNDGEKMLKLACKAGRRKARR